MLRHRVEVALSPPFSLPTAAARGLSASLKVSAAERCALVVETRGVKPATPLPQQKPIISIQKQHHQPTRAGVLSCDRDLTRSIECAPRSLAAPSVPLSHLHFPINFILYSRPDHRIPSGSAGTLEEAAAIAKQPRSPPGGPA